MSRCKTSQVSLLLIAIAHAVLTTPRYGFSGTIKILAGEAETEFDPHEDVLVRASKFFRAACGGDFKEAKEKIIRLPKIQAETFRAYLHWAYFEEISLLTAEEDEMDGKGQKRMKAAVDLYIAADIFDDEKLRNASVKYIAQVSNSTCKVAGPELVTAVYSSTTDGPLLRKAMIDQYFDLSADGRAWFKAYKEELPSQFVDDIADRGLQNNSYGYIRDEKDAPSVCEHYDAETEILGPDEAVAY